MTPARKRDYEHEPDADYDDKPAPKKRSATFSVGGGRPNIQKQVAQAIKGQNVRQGPKGLQARDKSAETPLTPPKEADVIDLSDEPEDYMESENYKEPKKQERGAAQHCVAPCHLSDADPRTFPRFNMEDVSISLQVGHPKYSYQLNSAILSEHSTWFKRTLENEVEEFDADLKEVMNRKMGLAHRYELEKDSGSKRWLLFKTCLTISQAEKSAQLAEMAHLKQLREQARRESKSDAASTVADFHVAIQSTPQSPKSLEDSSMVKNNEGVRCPIPVESEDCPTMNKAGKETTTNERLKDNETQLSAGPGKEEELATAEREKDEAPATIKQNEEAVLTTIEVPGSVEVLGNVEQLNIADGSDTEQTTTIEVPESVKVSVEQLNNTDLSAIEQTTTDSETKPDTKENNITSQTPDPDLANQEPTKKERFEAYNNLFLIYYNKSPEIDTTNIQVALSQSELLVSLADYYGSLPTVRLHINYPLTKYGKELNRAILRNPARWLILSTYLENATIFQECIIHIVGNYPNWPWKTVPKNKLSAEVLTLIQRKAAELQTLRFKVNEELFSSTLMIEGKEVVLGSDNKTTVDTWCTVQIWRDWLCRALNRAKASRPTKIIDAKMYRTMAKGGDAYLTFANVKTLREEYDVTKLDCAQWKAEELKEDLEIMKKYAQKQVAPLLENRSMLSVEEEEIGYFTCTRVESDELPWVKEVGTMAR